MNKHKKIFSFARLLTDISLPALLAANIAAFAAVEITKESLTSILWAYWFQSVAIGVVNYQYIKSLRNFSSTNFKYNGRPLSDVPDAKNKVARFFLIHYNIFHFAYLVGIVMINIDYNTLEIDLSHTFSLPALGGGLLFGVYHILHYKLDKSAYDPDARVHIGAVMFLPYLRILPMHLAIVFGAFSPAAAFTTFIWLKISADVIMQLYANRRKYFIYKPAGS